MKKNNTQTKKNNKKKILLATLIPAGAIALTAAIVTPTVILTRKPSTKEVSKIEVASATTSFTVGQKFSSSGLKLKVTYKDSSTETVTSGFKTNLDGKTLDSTCVGPSTEVTVTYEGKTCKYNIEVSLAEPKDFSATSIVDMSAAINGFENSIQDEASMRWLCNQFTGIPYVDSIELTNKNLNEQVEAHLVNFIGQTTTIKINDQTHTIRVIGINHDRLASSTEDNPKYAAFTFDLVTLLSGSDGNAMTCKWDTTNNHDYTNSELRANLNGTGNGTRTFDSTAFSMLPSELQSVIKTVNKKVATYNSTTREYEVKSEGYNDKLFPLTRTEIIATPSTYAKTEGTTYKYSKDGGLFHKADANKLYKLYPLTSPNITNSSFVWWIPIGSGIYNDLSVTSANAVSFAFCI